MVVRVDVDRGSWRLVEGVQELCQLLLELAEVRYDWGEKRSSLRTDRCITQVYIHVGSCPKVVRA